MHAAGSPTAAIDTPPLSLEINNKHQDSAAVASVASVARYVLAQVS